MEQIYGAYSEKNDITFIMKDVKNDNGETETTEVIGFVYGNEVDNLKVLNQYTGRLKAVFTLEQTEEKKIKTVPPTEFITAWNDMEKYWVNNDGDNDENSYYNRIINQPINIELPLLGIKTELFWCPPTVECLDDMFKRMVEETYFDLLVEKEDCFSTGGGIWLAEVPFEYGDKSLVMVVNNEDSSEWAIYQNVLKDNGKYESVEYEELMEFTGNANNILPDFQIYYIRALQLLADR